MSKSIMVYGVGKLGESIIRGLIDRNIKVFHESYNGPNDNEYIIDHKNVLVDILNSSKLKNNIHNKELKNQVSYIVVTLTGEILEKEIDFLLSLDIPLIILSTKFDEKLVVQKANAANAKVLMSQNMALGIIDFWNRIQKIPSVPDEVSEIYFYAIESHQNAKADISGSAIKALELFRDKGVCAFFDEEERKSFQKGIDGEYGCIQCIRTEEVQLNELKVPKEYLSGHGYHTFSLFPEKWDDNSVKYLNSLYNEFKTLESYSINGVFEFKVFLEQDNGLIIVHNINGRDIYTDGVVKSINFLEKQANNGIYTAIDVIKIKNPWSLKTSGVLFFYFSSGSSDSGSSPSSRFLRISSSFNIISTTSWSPMDWLGVRLIPNFPSSSIFIAPKISIMSSLLSAVGRFCLIARSTLSKSSANKFWSFVFQSVSLFEP